MVSSLLFSLQLSVKTSSWICLCSWLHNSSLPFYQCFPCEFMTAIHSKGSNHGNFCIPCCRVHTLYSCCLWKWDKASNTDISKPARDARNETLGRILFRFVLVWCWICWICECVSVSMKDYTVGVWSTPSLSSFTKLLNLLSRLQKSWAQHEWNVQIWLLAFTKWLIQSCNVHHTPVWTTSVMFCYFSL